MQGLAARRVLLCCNRHIDWCPRDIDSAYDVSVHRQAACDTTKGGLTLAVLFCTVPTGRARSRRVALVQRVQWHAGKSSLVGKELTQLPKCPGGMARTLRTSNRAIGAFPNVPNAAFVKSDNKRDADDNEVS